jgi:hypothetical protein
MNPKILIKGRTAEKIKQSKNIVVEYALSEPISTYHVS